MVDRAKEAKRAQAEERFKKVQAAEAAAKEIIETDRAFVRKKTERLRALRLAKEAGVGVTEIDKKKPAKKPAKKRAKKA